MGDAVVAEHTAAVVDGFVVDIDTHGFAAFLTLAAATAFLAVDADAEERVLAEETQQRSHGADGVAPEASPEEADDEDNHQRNDGDDQRQSRREESRGHAGESAVGVDGNGNAVGDAEGTEHHKECQDAVAQPVERSLVVEFVVEDDAVEPGEEVLQDAEGADNRAVDSPTEHGYQQNGYDNNDVERQDGRQELHLGHPAQLVNDEPGLVEHPGKAVDEQDRDANEHDGCQDNTNVFQCFHKIAIIVIQLFQFLT